MPLYEYFCPKCESKYELLRPLSRMDEPAVCKAGHSAGERVLSMFAVMSRGSDGEVSSVGGCACGGGNCGCGDLN
jgi:putative FmdB family regulatory protein